MTMGRGFLLFCIAKKLGLTVIAQGAETYNQVQILKDFGCDIVQGHFYSRALSKEAMGKLLIK